MLSPMLKRALLLPAACALVFVLAGCDSAKGGDAPELVAREHAGGALPTIRIHPHGRYYFEGDAQPVPADQLVDRIRGAFTTADAQRERRLRVLAYPGVEGYDVVLVTNQAREAGVHWIDGIAEYTDDASPIRQKTVWKRWQHELVSIPRHPVVDGEERLP